MRLNDIPLNTAEDWNNLSQWLGNSDKYKARVAATFSGKKIVVFGDGNHVFCKCSLNDLTKKVADASANTSDIVYSEEEKMEGKDLQCRASALEVNTTLTTLAQVAQIKMSKRNIITRILSALRAFFSKEFFSREDAISKNCRAFNPEDFARLFGNERVEGCETRFKAAEGMINCKPIAPFQLFNEKIASCAA